MRTRRSKERELGEEARLAILQITSICVLTGAPLIVYLSSPLEVNYHVPMGSDKPWVLGRTCLLLKHSDLKYMDLAAH